MNRSFDPSPAGLGADSARAAGFPTTLWTVVLKAGHGDSGAAAAALATLCRSYWYPLYAFVRRRGNSPHDSEDLTQAFLATLIEKHGLETVDRERGRFRTFLLAALKNFLANEWDKVRALKRGGGRQVVSFDRETAESRYVLEPSHDYTPDRHFERQWGLTLLDQVLAALRDEYHAAGNGPLFEELKSTLGGKADGYREIAIRLGRTEGAVKVAAHRLRRRYRELMNAQIAQTVADGDIEDELRYLLAVLAE